MAPALFFDRPGQKSGFMSGLLAVHIAPTCNLLLNAVGLKNKVGRPICRTLSVDLLRYILGDARDDQGQTVSLPQVLIQASGGQQPVSGEHRLATSENGAHFSIKFGSLSFDMGVTGNLLVNAMRLKRKIIGPIIFALCSYGVAIKVTGQCGNRGKKNTQNQGGSFQRVDPFNEAGKTASYWGHRSPQLGRSHHTGDATWDNVEGRRCGGFFEPPRGQLGD